MDLAVIAVSLNDLSDDTKNAITVATLGSSDDLKLVSRSSLSVMPLAMVSLLPTVL